ncbi:hypothetical protein SETIT_1G035700v2 [Setaria italica]|uniref:Uncharacterized protein n=1 Tax=Setaria italica TaxID=4555 RepID=K3YW97_SETIT|nr:uncharacterized protein LOC111255651 [Setaria italica]RCV04867.1 hypothetical protein SETIT_1G035700v2 [Setaria italica]
MATAHQAVTPRPREEDPAAERLIFVPVEQQADYQQDGRQGNNGDGAFPWLTLLGFGFLTFNSVMAILRAQGDRMAIAFVGFSYADLVALFACLRMYESAPAGSSKRDWLKIAVWILTTLLTLAFSGKVAAVMPPPVAVVVWLMAFATIAGGFVTFFIYKEKK